MTNIVPAGPERPTVESEVKVPSDRMAMADAFGRWFHWTHRGGAGVFSRSSGPDSNGDQLSAARQRHGGQLNVVFCDGQVEGVASKKLFYDRTNDPLRRWNRDNRPHAEGLITQAAWELENQKSRPF